MIIGLGSRPGMQRNSTALRNQRNQRKIDTVKESGIEGTGTVKVTHD